MLNPYLLTIEKNNTEYVVTMFPNIPNSSLLRLEVPEINDEEIKNLRDNGECVINSKKYILSPWIQD